ncbi:MAG: hypothetical protein CR954_00470 [Candidatus Moraniibacteriota bacterium]|nr:MAG: hypothetical protein CR954_00470 [Candidatus Moranbacteria bacterium]
MDTPETQAQNIQETIAKEFGFTDFTDDAQKELISRMTESVIKRVLIDAYTKLSESDRATFEEMMEDADNTNPDAVDAFLREKLTDYDGIIQQAIADLKEHIASAGEVNTAEKSAE